jgi:hypothetical protein
LRADEPEFCTCFLADVVVNPVTGSTNGAAQILARWSMFAAATILLAIVY